MTTNDPWYTRSELWVTLASVLMGFFGQKSQNPMVQNIGATLAGLAPIVYTWGRSNVKVQQAATVMGAVGQVLSVQATSSTPPSAPVSAPPLSQG